MTMATSRSPLLRLATLVEQQLPGLVLFAIVRHAVVRVSAPLLRRVPLARKVVCTLQDPVFERAQYLLQIGIALYYTLDAYENWDPEVAFPDCRSRRVPRPIGIAAGLALVYFVCTVRATVSIYALVVLLCAKDANWMTGPAVLVAGCEYVQSDSAIHALAIGTVAIGAAWHGTVCVSSSSAALAVASFVWVQLWLVWRLLRSLCNGLLSSLRKAQ
tara:strand:- start:665 stop:1312 length:648 start_codon:yes stop_codon:yes gene_type:complete